MPRPEEQIQEIIDSAPNMTSAANKVAAYLNQVKATNPEYYINLIVHGLGNYAPEKDVDFVDKIKGQQI